MTFKSLALAGAAALALTCVNSAFGAKMTNVQEQQITAQLNEQQAASPGSMPTVQATSSAKQGDTLAMTDSGGPAGAAKASPPPTTPVGKAATEAGNQIDQASGVKEPVTHAEMRSAVSLAEVDDPSQTLKTAELKNTDGQAVGEVHAVKIGSDGKVTAIDADVGGFLGVGQRVVALDPSDLVYLERRNLLVTKLSKADLAKLPAVKTGG